MIPAPAVQVEVAAQVQADPQALYEAAVTARLAGRHAEAVDLLNRVLALRPADVDARLNLGLSLLALGRIPEAETAFRTVLDQAPGYADAEVGLARAAELRGDREAAREHATRALILSPGRQDVAAFRRSLDAVAWRGDIDVSRSRLSAGLPDWTMTRLGVARSITPVWSVSGSVERTEQFNQVDVYVEGRIDRRMTGADAYVALGGTPEADHRPEVIVMAGGSALIAPDLRATLDASAARYVTGSVESLQPGVTGALFNGRFEITARWINVWDETDRHRSGYAARAAWQVTDRFRLSAGHADAPETSEGVVVDVVATSLGAAFDITDRVTLRLGVVDEDRVSYTREEVAVGLGWRF
ncbi:YaiO family outer membrane beta-barrel protein [Brevundimonas sp. Root1279]|uniref:YaiO family outer membrane beta-barrel protein n=1 Tax=Brevundimonas sp. Root1279 TaxID=1736443 RepID=UPI000701BC4F|nr:YaiO family outer membrane beta-barrel protein [Brevundimonas sp. Root1279]KQW78740.1 hypothetical protein ASC65_15600 [Brevundimonas sp. Root1279]